MYNFLVLMPNTNELVIKADDPTDAEDVLLEMGFESRLITESQIVFMGTNNYA